MFEFRDDIGQVLYFEKLPQKIISLVPSITATFFDLHAEDLLVGRTKFCIHPVPEVDAVPIVGGTKHILLDKIVALQPDIIICNQEENTLDTFERLQQQQIPVFVNETKTIPDNSKLISQLGMITGKTEAAQQLCLRIERELDTVKNLFSGNKAIYLIWKGPCMSVGNDTFIHSILQHIGLDNCMKKYSRYPELTIEEIVDIAPDYLLLSTEPYPFKQQHVEYFQELLPHTKVILVQGEYFSWYGSKMQGAAEYFKQLYSEI